MSDDPQKEAVYEWEGGFADWNRQTLTLSAVRAHVRTACAHYGLPPPAVRAHPGDTWAYSMGHVVSFPGWCKNMAVALHEAAHYICGKHCPNARHDHGPSWLGIYLWLLEEARVAPRAALCASARRHGLRWRRLPPERFLRRQE